MFGFLKSFVGYPTEMLKLIREQNNIGFDGYFKHEEICIPLLEFIYNRKTKKYRSEINASQDVALCK